MNQVNPRARHRARELILQALYQWQLSDTEVTEIERQFIEHGNLKSADTHYFQNLLFEITKQAEALDQSYIEFCSRPLAEITPIEQSLLRLASYELQNRLDIPYKVIINEALELNKTYGNEEGFKFVNAVLDQVAKKYRADEFKG